MSDLPRIINDQEPPIDPAIRDQIGRQIEEASQQIRKEMEDRLKALDDVFLSFGEETTDHDYFPFFQAGLEMQFWAGGGIRQVLDFIKEKGSLAGAFLMAKKLLEDRDWIFDKVDSFIEAARNAKSIQEVEWEPRP